MFTSRHHWTVFPKPVSRLTATASRGPTEGNATYQHSNAAVWGSSLCWSAVLLHYL
jgi:hypothetical protein